MTTKNAATRKAERNARQRDDEHLLWIINEMADSAAGLSLKAAKDCLKSYGDRDRLAELLTGLVANGTLHLVCAKGGYRRYFKCRELSAAWVAAGGMPRKAYIGRRPEFARGTTLLAPVEIEADEVEPAPYVPYVMTELTTRVNPAECRPWANAAVGACVKCPA